jgi:integrase
MKITKLAVDKLAIPVSETPNKTAQKRYYDETLKGFGVRVTSGGTKAFFIEKLIHGKLRRITLGHSPALTVEQARKEAHKLLGKIATGIDPIIERKEIKAKQITLQELFDDYLETRKSLSKITLDDYKRVINESFDDWKNKPICSITRDMVAERHTKLGENSHARANLSMRVLRALYNFAIAKHEDNKGNTLIIDNPVKRLSQTRAWFRVDRRQTHIKAHQLAAWFAELIKIENKTIRDYLFILLFTGLRRNDAETLKWEQVDLKSKILTFPDPKNHQHHELPIPTFLLTILKERKKLARNEFVFPGNGESGHLVEPRKQMEKIIQHSKVKFTPHDLRRTFITIAESLDIPAYALKRLMNHKMKQDVTAGYIISDVERLRKPMQEICNFILQKAGKAAKEFTY